MLITEDDTMLEHTIIATHSECYNAHIDLQCKYSGDTIIEWRDDEVEQAVEDGFLDASDWHGSALAQAEELGLIEEYDDEIYALAEHLECNPGEISEASYGASYDCGNQSYLVVSDETADELEDEALDSYINDCMEMDDNVRMYFDDEKWKSDARMDGRDHCLALYDGAEEESQGFYIYRTN